MKIPIEWLSGKTILTAAQVKKLDPGAEVWIHKCYGRRGEHVYVKATVMQSGKKKVLRCYDYMGLPEYKPITDAENIAYTAD